MSDPFEAFESANGANGKGNGANDDPAAAFLAREELEFAKVVNNDFSNDAFGSFGKQFQTPHRRGLGLLILVWLQAKALLQRPAMKPAVTTRSPNHPNSNLATRIK